VIYLDTNVLLYATLSVVDDETQKLQAIKVLKDTVKSNSLVLSNLSLLEYSFVMQKANEDIEKIQKGINFFKTFVLSEKEGFSNYLIGKLDNRYAIKNSFDLYHISFADFVECKSLITFDKGFKKFDSNFDVYIDIL